MPKNAGVDCDMNDLMNTFDIMKKDQKLATVLVDKKTFVVNIIKEQNLTFFDDRFIPQMETLDELNSWVENRCPPRTRADIDILLQGLGLSFYAPFNIVQKTNGAMFEDEYWLRFRENETWDSVNPRKREYGS